jgi:hypothetical protein
VRVFVVATLAIGASFARADEPPVDALELLYQVYTERIRNDAADVGPTSGASAATVPAGASSVVGNKAGVTEFQRLVDARVQAALPARQPNGSFAPGLRPLRNFFVAESPAVHVLATEYRVDGSYPACGGGAPEVGKDVTAIESLLGGAGKALDASLQTGYLFTGLAGLVGYAIHQNQQYQKDARCAKVCALVPASLSDTDFDVEGEITPDGGSSVVDWILQRQVTTREPQVIKKKQFLHGWTILQAPAPLSGELKIPVEKGAIIGRDVGPSCSVKLLCSTVKHWSHGYSVTARVRVRFDATEELIKTQCTDFTMVDRGYRPLLYQAMPMEKARTYLSERANQEGKPGNGDPRLVEAP